MPDPRDARRLAAGAGAARQAADVPVPGPGSRSLHVPAWLLAIPGPGGGAVTRVLRARLRHLAGQHHADWHAPPAGQRAALPSSRRRAPVSTDTSGARLGSDNTVICSVPA